VWTSDNTEAFDRLTIQQGFTYAYTPHVMMAWVTDVPNMNGRSVPLQFRFLVAMQGSLGIGSNLNKWQQEDFALARQMVDYYKSIRQTVENGDLYRLTPPSDTNFKATQYVSPDKSESVLFAFLHSQQFGRTLPAITLKGLDENVTYSVTLFDGKTRKTPPLSAKLSGSYLMNHGLVLPLTGDYDATSVKIDRTTN